MQLRKIAFAVLLGSTSALPAVSAAQAQTGAARQSEYNIPAGDLAAGLRAFARQSHIEVMFNAAHLRGQRTAGVRGNLSAEEALRQLLAGSRAELVRDSSGAFLVRPARAAAMRPAAIPVSTAALAMPSAPPPAARSFPQPEVRADAPPAIEDIIVTAQKREENLQDTPISMVAMGAQALEQRGINSLGDLYTGGIPSVRIAPFAGRPSAVSIGMRGLVPNDVTQITRDPTVGVYVDGVYLGRVSGLGLEIADVERIEVLRGPQGTLFGRNALGGAISVVSRRPSGELGVDLKAGVGNYDNRSLATHINLPEFHGLSLKFDGLVEKRDGLVENPFAGSHDYGEIDKLGARVSALWKPSDNFSLLYAWDYAKEKPTTNYYYILGSGVAAASKPAFFAFDEGRTDAARIGLPVEPSPQRSEGHSVTAEWNVSDALLVRSITSWRSLNSLSQDQDVGAITTWGPNRRFGRFSVGEVKQNQFSQELQLVGEAGELKYVAGIFYFNERARDTSTAYSATVLDADLNGVTFFPALSPDAGEARTPDRSSEVQAKSKALFAQATWSPASLEGLHATVGARYTDDSKNGRLTAVGGVDPRLAFSFKSSRFDPMATLAYDFSRDINGYVKWSRAYRAGGANSRSFNFTSFNEEVLTAWEVGMKADFFDRRMRLNIAAYRSILSDQQTDFTNPVNPSNTETLNAPEKRRIKGLELDAIIVPVRGMTLSASYIYTDAPSTAVRNPFTGVTENVYSYFTAKHAANFAVDYIFGRLSFGEVAIHLDGSTVGNFIVNQNPDRRTEKDFIVNGRLSLKDIDLLGGNVELALWGKNLTNKTYMLIEIDNRRVGRQQYGVYNDPRTFGVEARLRF